MKLGDAIATVAQPIARGVDRVFRTDFQNCPGCHQMQADLNAGMSLVEALKNRFWQRKVKMEFIVTEAISQPYLIEAETAQEALQKRKNGEGKVLPNRSEHFTVGLAPKTPEPPQRPQPEKPTAHLTPKPPQ
jgi:hypothetical protein